jgi:hypothetical protein
MMWGYTTGWSWGNMAFMTISMLFWLAVISLLVFLFVRWLGHANTGPDPL